MQRILCSALFVCVAVAPMSALRKPHLVSFGKWQTVRRFVDTPPPSMTDPQNLPWAEAKNVDTKGVEFKIRPLYVDGQLKESTTGFAHEITDRIFVVRRAYRVNDSLPAEEGKNTRWRWELGGWLEVDRVTGRVSALNLPEFDASTSSASWYREYAGYCGVSDDGKKLHAMVVILGRRKPIVKALLGDANERTREADCAAPTWQRQPAGITFETGASKVTYLVRGYVADLVPEEVEDDVPSE